MLVYDTLEQARLRLRTAVITYRDSACYVVDVTQPKKSAPIELLLQPYPVTKSYESAADRVSIRIDDPDLNFRVFKLGYLNDALGKRCGFITRQTRRQQIQGVVTGSLMGLEFLTGGAHNRKEFEDMLLGRYPTVDEALNLINNEDWESVGISQYFALTRDPDIRLLRSLMYRGRRVGVSLGSTFTEFLIDKKDAYLKEVLQEAGFPFRVE